MFVLWLPPPPQSPFGTEQMIIIYWRQTIATFSIWDYNCMVLMMWSELGEEHKSCDRGNLWKPTAAKSGFLNQPQRHFFRIRATLYHCDAVFISFILKIYIRNKLIESIMSLRPPLCPNEAYRRWESSWICGTSLNRRRKVSQLNAKRVRFDYAIGSSTYA